MSTFRLEFITPLFSRGAYEGRPEIRPPSIRGQLHWWFRALGGNYHDEKAIFGGVHNGATASKLVIRVGDARGQMGELPTLPHKTGERSSPKPCFLPGASFELHILTRLGGLSRIHESLFQRALEAWLLLGSLGLRSTRAGGCFCWEPVCETTIRCPADWTAFEQRCAVVLQGGFLRFGLLDEIYTNSDAARHVVTDTLGGPDQPDDVDDLRKLNWPLGDVASKRQQREDPTRKDRKTSPLRFRIVKIACQFRIAALWDARDQVTHNDSKTDLPGIIRLLEQKKPGLGRQLAASALAGQRS